VNQSFKSSLRGVDEECLVDLSSLSFFLSLRNNNNKKKVQNRKKEERREEEKGKEENNKERERKFCCFLALLFSSRPLIGYIYPEKTQKADPAVTSNLAILRLLFSLQSFLENDGYVA